MITKGYYKKHTRVLWRKIGDSILVASAGLTGVIMGSPLSDTVKAWSVSAVNLIGVVGKILSNFFKQPDKSWEDAQAAEAVAETTQEP